MLVMLEQVECLCSALAVQAVVTVAQLLLEQALQLVDEVGWYYSQSVAERVVLVAHYRHMQVEVP
jgi:hypothetical protein